jgi:hypothetical protein
MHTRPRARRRRRRMLRERTAPLLRICVTGVQRIETVTTSPHS